MEHALFALLAALAGMVLVSTVWLGLVGRHRRRERALADQLRAARAELGELEVQAARVLALARRALPVGRRPELPREVAPLLDEALQEWSRELKQLQQRLVVNLHVIAQLRQSEEQLNARVGELEAMLIGASDYELRVRYRAATVERDRMRDRLIALQQALAPGCTDLPAQIAALSHQNEALSGELRQSRRLVQVLQRQVSALQREEADRAGIAMRGLQQHDVEPGAFDSVSDLVHDDPEEHLRSWPGPPKPAAGSLDGYDRPRPAGAGSAPASQAEPELPRPVAPSAPDGGGGRRRA